MSIDVKNSPKNQLMPERNTPQGQTNNTLGLIKDNALQLSDGYLSRTPIFQYLLLSICFPMWGIAASLNDI